MHEFLRPALLGLILGSYLFQSCESPFQPKEDYSPKLVLYGIAFRGDSVLSVRVETNSEAPPADSSTSKPIRGLAGTLSSLRTGTEFHFTAKYTSGVNMLDLGIRLSPGTFLKLNATADGYPGCTASSAVLDSALIYPAYWTTSVLRAPDLTLQDPQFTIYPSSSAKAIRVVLHLRYHGIDDSGKTIRGDLLVNPAYQSSSTSYFLKIDGRITNVRFPTAVYADSFAVIRTAMKDGVITAVVGVTQIDAAIYNFYNIANGFNDPLTMRTEKPLYTNVGGGLGFFGSASRDSFAVQVYP